MKNRILAVLGAVAGGVAGYFAFALLLRQGLYAMVIPGGFVGLGAGIFKSRSVAIAAICGAIALGASLFTEWSFGPFIANGSFTYFLTHSYQLPPIKILMIAAGTVLGFWIPFRRTQEALPGRQ